MNSKTKTGAWVMSHQVFRCCYEEPIVWREDKAHLHSSHYFKSVKTKKPMQRPSGPSPALVSLEIIQRVKLRE